MKRNEAPRREERQPRAPGARPRPREAAGGRGVLSAALPQRENACGSLCVGTRLGVKRKHTTSRKEEREPHPGETSQLSENSPPAQRLLPVRGGSVAHAALRAETPDPRGEATLCSLGVDFTPTHVADPAGGQTHPRASALASLRPEGEDPRRSTKGCLNCGGARCGARG